MNFQVLAELGVLGSGMNFFKLCAKCSKYDLALFYWKNEGILQGLMSMHVDDFCWEGAKMF